LKKQQRLHKDCLAAAEYVQDPDAWRHGLALAEFFDTPCIVDAKASPQERARRIEQRLWLDTLKAALP
jgi:hypothetical protein